MLLTAVIPSACEALLLRGRSPAAWGARADGDACEQQARARSLDQLFVSGDSFVFAKHSGSCTSSCIYLFLCATRRATLYLPSEHFRALRCGRRGDRLLLGGLRSAPERAFRRCEDRRKFLASVANIAPIIALPADGSSSLPRRLAGLDCVTSCVPAIFLPLQAKRIAAIELATSSAAAVPTKASADDAGGTGALGPLGVGVALQPPAAPAGDTSVWKMIDAVLVDQAALPPLPAALDWCVLAGYYAHGQWWPDS